MHAGGARHHRVPALDNGDTEPLHALVPKYDTSIVPGRWFDMPDRFRVGLGGAGKLKKGLVRRSRAGRVQMKKADVFEFFRRLASPTRRRKRNV